MPTSTGFSLPKEEEAFKTGLEDFARYRDKKQWAAAFRALSTVLEGPLKGFASTPDGFQIPSKQSVRTALLTLPADGLEAYRLFFDAKADQLFKKATAKPADEHEPAADDVPILQQIVDQMFLTTNGPSAADRLGDALFEAGSFTAAAEQWRLMLTSSPDPAVGTLRIHVKRATALARLQRWDAFDDLVKTITAKFPGESVKIAGRSEEVAGYLQSLRQVTPSTQPTDADATQQMVGLPDSDKEAWQTQFLNDETATSWRDQLASMGWSRFMDSLDTTIPAAAVDGQRVYTNWLGVVFANDLKTGKLLWRSNKFSEITSQGTQLVQMGVSSSTYALTAIGGRVFAVGSMPSNNGQRVNAPLRCFDPETGREKWSSAKGALAGSMICGSPIMIGEALCCIAVAQGTTNMELVALNPDTGNVLRRMTLGTAVMSTNFRGEQVMTTPILKADGTTLYVLTNNGALIVVDTGSFTVSWALKTDTPPPVGRENMFFSDSAPETKIVAPGALFVDRGLMYFKERTGRSLYALDPSVPKLIWKRPLEKEQSIVAARDGRLLTAGEAAGSIDATSYALQWSSLLRTQTGQMNPVFAGDQEVLFTSRGLYVIATSTGEVQKIIRGADRGAIGGNLLVAGNRLITVSNRAVTAYALPN